MGDRADEFGLPAGLAVPRRAWEAVHDALRDAILSEELRPGTRLVEMAIAERFGLSQGPVREALARLEEQGLVEARGRRGRYVSSVPVETGRVLFELRARVEPLAGRLALERLGPAEIGEMERYLEIIRTAESVAARVDADMAFHRMLYELSEFPPLMTLWEQMELQIRRLRPVSASSVTFDVHRQMLDALVNRDEVALEAAVALHMKTTWSEPKDEPA